jgi:hypothetical protein
MAIPTLIRRHHTRRPILRRLCRAYEIGPALLSNSYGAQPDISAVIAQGRPIPIHDGCTIPEQQMSLEALNHETDRTSVV